MTTVLLFALLLALLAEPFLGTENPYLYGGLGLLFSASVYLARKTAELEEARQLQLALLPRQLPVLERYDRGAVDQHRRHAGGGCPRAPRGGGGVVDEGPAAGRRRHLRRRQGPRAAIGCDRMAPPPPESPP